VGPEDVSIVAVADAGSLVAPGEIDSVKLLSTLDQLYVTDAVFEQGTEMLDGQE
jgi:hypothetical protein